jgi:16S rRNA (uracil1498-N3)-methyltransferase
LPDAAGSRPESRFAGAGGASCDQGSSLRGGDVLTLFNGTGGEYRARIAASSVARVSVEVSGWLATEREPPLSITLVQALQAGEKMDLTVQKAVELGVDRIVPVISRRSVLRLEGERALRRLEHWRGVVVAACEQCGRNRLPEVLLPERLEHWLARNSPAGDGALRLMLAPARDVRWRTVQGPPVGGAVELLVGAEGGLAPEEARLAAIGWFSVGASRAADPAYRDGWPGRPGGNPVFVG